MYAISSYVNLDISNGKISQELNNNICYMRTEHFLASTEKQRDEGGSRILQAVQRSSYGRSDFGVSEL